MRQKTRLSIEEQVSRTLALVLPFHEIDIDVGIQPTWANTVGQIIKPHRLFNVGDIVWVYLNNGQASRWPVYAVSSKGYTIDGYYLQYARWRHDFRYHRLKFRHTVRLPLETKRFPKKMFEFIELPVDLRTLSPDEPDVQRYLVETLRAGDSAVRGRHG